jgi:hypothetical protein
MVYLPVTAWILASHRVSARPEDGRACMIFSLRRIPGSRSRHRPKNLRCAPSGRSEWSLRGRGVLSGQDPGHAGGPARRGGPEVGRSGQRGDGEARRLPRGLPARDHYLLPGSGRSGRAGDGRPDRAAARAPWGGGRLPALRRLRHRVLDHLLLTRRLRGAVAQDHSYPERRGHFAVRGPLHEALLLPAAARDGGFQRHRRRLHAALGLPAGLRERRDPLGGRDPDARHPVGPPGYAGAGRGGHDQRGLRAQRQVGAGDHGPPPRHRGAPGRDATQRAGLDRGRRQIQPLSRSSGRLARPHSRRRTGAVHVKEVLRAVASEGVTGTKRRPAT